MSDPAPLTDSQVNLLKREAERQIGASVNDTLRLLATVEQARRERDDADQKLRNALVQISDALGLPLTEAGRPRANSFLYREIGRFIECHDWDWPPEHPGDAIRRARAVPGAEGTTDE